MCEGGVFSKLSDDVILNILYKLEEDPRNWARVSCISTKFSSLIRTVCFRSKCSQSIPAVVSDLLLPSGGWAWASLFKLSVCCPGLIHSGVPLDNSDFGIEREIGSHDQSYKEHGLLQFTVPEEGIPESSVPPASTDCTWSLHDDLLFGESSSSIPPKVEEEAAADSPIAACKRRKICVRPRRSHLASGIWNLSREQGNKLLASRFKGDCLYICDWPGCIHIEEKRNYMLFRGIFKNFKQSRVWRTISDDGRNNRSKIIELNCIYCSSKEIWDLHSSFCLRRYFGYHDDGEPVVRAYVCENGHVSGAWTNWPLYT